MWAPPEYANAVPEPILPKSISHSNQGLSNPAEINPFWALVADPSSATYLNSPNNASNGAALALQQYRGFFGLSNQNPNSNQPNSYILNNWVEMANMELARLFWGAPNYNVTLNGLNEVFQLNNVTAGRWGDVGNLLSALNSGSPGSSPPQLFNSTTSLWNFPLPGIPYFDDNGNLFAGLTDSAYDFTSTTLGYNSQSNGQQLGGDPTNYQLPIFSSLANGHLLLPISGSINGNTKTLFPTMVAPNPGYNSPITVLPFGQPLDFMGAGTWTVGAGTWTTAVSSSNGQKAYTNQPNPNLPGMYLYYNGYPGSLFAASGASSSPIIPSQLAFAQATTPHPFLSTVTSHNGQHSAALRRIADLANTNFNGLVDEPEETVSINAYAQTSDQIFSLDDTAALQLSQNDYTAAVGQSRVRQLASFNFEQNLQAAAIRQRFTTASFDRKNHGFGSAVNPSANVTPQYPPNNPNGERTWEYTTVQQLGWGSQRQAAISADGVRNFVGPADSGNRQQSGDWRKSGRRAVPHGAGRLDRGQAQQQCDQRHDVDQRSLTAAANGWLAGFDAVHQFHTESTSLTPTDPSHYPCLGQPLAAATAAEHQPAPDGRRPELRVRALLSSSRYQQNPLRFRAS